VFSVAEHSSGEACAQTRAAVVSTVEFIALAVPGRTASVDEMKAALDETKAASEEIKAAGDEK
jgi:hypothetical protein